MQSFDSYILLEESAIQREPTTNCSLSVCTRNGHNGPWEIANHSPAKVHKCRKIGANIDATNFPYAVLFQLKLLHGHGARESCYIHSARNVTPNIQQLSFSCDGTQAFTAECFLLTRDDRLLPRKDVLYQLSINIVFQGHLPITVHNWELKPTKSHKWETTKKGKIANNTNNRSIQYPIYLPEQSEATCSGNPAQDSKAGTESIYPQLRAPYSIQHTSEYYEESSIAEMFDLLIPDNVVEF